MMTSKQYTANPPKNKNNINNNNNNNNCKYQEHFSQETRKLVSKGWKWWSASKTATNHP